METFYIWKREGNFWHRVEVSKEDYFSRVQDYKPMGNEYEYHGPNISREDGPTYREQRLK